MDRAGLGWVRGDGVKTPGGKRLAVKSGWNRSLLRWPLGKKVKGDVVDFAENFEDLKIWQRARVLAKT